MYASSSFSFAERGTGVPDDLDREASFARGVLLRFGIDVFALTGVGVRAVVLEGLAEDGEV
jgi:hypothetical protein